MKIENFISAFFGLFGLLIGVAITLTINSPKLKRYGEPISISDVSGKITVAERLSPRNLAIVKGESGGEKIVSDLPIGLEKGDIFIIDKNGKVSKLTEVKK